MTHSIKDFGLRTPETIPHQIVVDIIAERIAAEQKHGDNISRPYTLDRAFAILSEEVGEVAECVVETGYFRDFQSKNKIPVDPMGPQRAREHWEGRLRKELVQVANYAIFMIEKLDEGKL